ncbi:MAG: NADH-quinone oxidoreductase subunit N [Schwartzia sp.]|nr:NADH-quinone oxidoreductase subunit N [Schwartzia sp. (in: firmicutes)]
MNFWAVSTEIFILVIMTVALAVDLVLPKKETRRGIGYLVISGLLAALVYTFGLYHTGPSMTFFDGLFLEDNYALFFKQLFILGMLFSVLFSLDYVEKNIKSPGEFYTLLMAALLGMCVMASANDLLTMFVGLELMTVSFYVLVGQRMDVPDSGEASVKYLVVGAGSTAVMLYGISLVYGATGSLDFAVICRSIQMVFSIGLAGIVLVMIGFFFKLSVIPFHMWAPDVYQGAPTPVTALLAMGSKAAGIAVFMRALYAAFPLLGGYWIPLLAVFAAICMVGGNIMAIRQTDVKRMLAYSSIAQAGYMMCGIASADAAGMKAVLFYAMLYVFANVGAFAVLTCVEVYRGGTTHTHLTGLAQSAPLLAAVMTVSLLSMAGIPPTAGFSGKMYIFTAAVERGYLWLAFIGFLMSMISVYYYLLVAKAMYRDLTPEEETANTAFRIPFGVRATVLLSVIATVGTGIYPELLAMLTNLASQTFMR